MIYCCIWFLGVGLPLIFNHVRFRQAFSNVFRRPGELETLWFLLTEKFSAAIQFEEPTTKGKCQNGNGVCYFTLGRFLWFNFYGIVSFQKRLSKLFDKKYLFGVVFKDKLGSPGDRVVFGVSVLDCVFQCVFIGFVLGSR